MSKARELAELGAVYDSGALSNRNLIINGGMQCWQRATTATTVSGASGVYDTVDRFKLWEDTDGAYTSERSTTVPDGFGYSLKLQVTTADTSLSSAQYSCIAQIIEARSLQHLAYGTDAAKDVTVSFYVRSNKTGTYGFCLEKNDSTRYLFVKEFTIDAADTWERKIIKVAPDSQIKASGGAIANNGGEGFRAFIFLASGSTYAQATNNAWNTNTNYFTTSNQVNWMDSTSNNFYLTGMQLEVGTEATPFEHRSIGDELLRCQRYLCTYAFPNTNARHYGSLDNYGYYMSEINFPVEMRASPSGIVTSAPTYSNCDNLRPSMSGTTGAVFYIDLDGTNTHFYAKDFSYRFDAEL